VQGQWSLLVGNDAADVLAVWLVVLQRSLLLDSRVLCDQQLNKCTKQCLASLADVVHKLEDTQVQWEFLL
jgi:hypothetical protein